MGKLHGLVFTLNKMHAHKCVTGTCVMLYIDTGQVISHIVILVIWETTINFPRKM